MTENSRITAQSKRIVRLLTMNRDEQRRRLEAEAERDRLRAENERLRNQRDQARADFANIATHPSNPLRARVAELVAELKEASLLAGHALSVLENGNLPHDRRIASALHVLREPALAGKEGE